MGSAASPPEMVISIHALREEGDRRALLREDSNGISIHALREEGDPLRAAVFMQTYISIHALREEGDNWVKNWVKGQTISIHALREEGDVRSGEHLCWVLQFLSTPSARRATAAFLFAGSWRKNFYPRPPRGGRR